MQAWEPLRRSAGWRGDRSFRGHLNPSSRERQIDSTPLAVTVPSAYVHASKGSTYCAHHRRPSSPLSSSPSPGFPRTPSEGPSPRATYNEDNELTVPHRPFARSKSPSGDSASTVSPATTPKGNGFPRHGMPVQDKRLKRSSVDRRMSALRGLVASFDFSDILARSPAPVTEEPGDDIEDIYAGYCRVEPTLSSRAHPGKPSGVSKAAPSGDYLQSQPTLIRRPSEDLSIKAKLSSVKSASQLRTTDAPQLPPFRSNHSFQDLAGSAALTSRRPQSAIVKSRPTVLRHHRSESEMKAPMVVPRPASRQRTEFFPVAMAGYSSTFGEHSQPPKAAARATSSTWRSGFANDREYLRFVRVHGQNEGARQEVVWELCETEKSFVSDLHEILRVFSKPLQTPQGRWMEGIRMQVAEAFAAIGEIYKVHENVSHVLDRLQSGRMFISMEDLVDAVGPLVPTLKVHEWLLVHFSEVNKCVDSMVQDPTCVFGEFIRMQLGVVDCKAQSLSDLLHKPMQRLMKYPLFLSRLLEMTPTRTPTHQRLAKLRASIDSLISTLQVAKGSYEDLGALRKLEARIEGLPLGFVLAKAGRRILLDTEAQRSRPSAADLASLGTLTSSFESSVQSRQSVSPFAHDAPSSRSSIVSNASSFACASSSRHSRSSSTNTSLSRSPSMVSSQSGGSRAPSRNSRIEVKSMPGGSSKTSAIRLLVCDDLVLILSLRRERRLFARRASVAQETLTAAPDIGVSQVMDVQEIMGQGGAVSMLAVSLLPHGQHRSESPTLLMLAPTQTSTITTIQTALQRSSPPLPSPVLMPSTDNHQEILTAQSDWGERAREVRRKRGSERIVRGNRI